MLEDEMDERFGFLWVSNRIREFHRNEITEEEKSVWWMDGWMEVKMRVLLVAFV